MADVGGDDLRGDRGAMILLHMATIGRDQVQVEDVGHLVFLALVRNVVQGEDTSDVRRLASEKKPSLLIGALLFCVSD